MLQKKKLERIGLTANKTKARKNTLVIEEFATGSNDLPNLILSTLDYLGKGDYLALNRGSHGLYDPFRFM